MPRACHQKTVNDDWHYCEEDEQVTALWEA